MRNTDQMNTVDRRDLNCLTRRSFLKASGLGTVALGTTGLAACSTGTQSTSGSRPRRGGAFRAALSGGTSSDSLNPLATVNGLDNARAQQLFDPLLTLDADVRPVLALAESVEPNKDATLWRLRVRKGVTFHNGKPLTADDVIFTFRLALNPKSPLPPANVLAPVDVANLKKLDTYTVEIPCSSPFATLPENIAGIYYTFGVVPVGFDVKHPVGTGAFKFKSFTPGVQSVFVRNPDYWMDGLPYFDSITLSDYSDETAQINALASGQADVVDLLATAGARTVIANGNHVVFSPGGGWTPFTMRVDQVPFRDVRVRQAMRYIVDRKQMLNLVFGGHGTLGNDVFSIWDPAYDHSLPQRESDPALARHLLHQAGYDNNLTLTLVTAPIAQGTVSAAQVFAQQARAAGVTVNLQQTTVTDFYGSNYLSWTFAQDFWYYSPYFAQVAQATLHKSPFNETHFDNPRYQQLYREGLATLDTTKRSEIAHEMQMIDYSEGGYIIPYFPPVIDGYSSRVKGVIHSKTGLPFNKYNLKALWFE